MPFLRYSRLGLLVVALLLAGCGSGGGESMGISGGAGIRADRSTVDVTARNNSDAPFEPVQITIDNPPRDGFFFREEFSGEGIERLSTQPRSDTSGTLFVQFLLAQQLPPGTYIGEARFIACEDQACTRPLRGSPLRIATRYTVPASVKPTTAVRFDNPLLTLDGLRGASERPSATAAFTISGSPSTGLTFRAEASTTRGVQQVEVDTLFGQSRINLTLRDSDTLDAGVYEDEVLLTVCLDSACTQQAQGSPARLTVRYSVLATLPPDAPLATIESSRDLPYDVRLAEYSAASDGLAIISVGQGPQLHFIELASGRERSVALPTEPLSLSFSPDGRSALVGQVGQISLVTLPADGSAPTVRNLRLTLSGRGAEVLLDGNGLAHVFPTSTGSGNVYTLRLATGVESDNRVSDRVDSGRARLLPAGNAFYVAEDSTDRGAELAVTRYNVSASTGMVSAMSRELRGEDFGGCGNLWLDPSLSRLVTACGAVLLVSATAAQDLRLLGRLPVVPGARPNTQRFASLSFGRAGEIAAAEMEQGCTPTGRERCQHHLTTYDADTFALRQRQSLPNLGSGNAERPREPLYVFESGGKRQVLSASQQAEGDRTYEWLTLP